MAVGLLYSCLNLFLLGEVWPLMSFSTHTQKSKLDELFVKQVMWGENKRKQRKVDRQWRKCVIIQTSTRG